MLNNILLTGKGRCNFTTAKPVSEIVAAFSKKGKFLYSALTKFSNTDLISFFEKRGIKTKVERGQRMFPVSDQAQTILSCLLKELRINKVKILFKARVLKIKKPANFFTLFLDNKSEIEADKVIIATGGKSYPQTGSSGDGYRFAKDLGHKIISPKPALASLICRNKRIRNLAGLSLKNVKLTFKANNKMLLSIFGEMLFTHLGVSGPMVLISSKAVYNSISKKEKVEALIDLKPALDKVKLKKRIYRDIHKSPKKEFQSLLKELLPKKLIYFTHTKLEIDKKRLNSSLTAKEVDSLVTFLKEFSFTIDAVSPLSTAIITNGGVEIDQINSQTMESNIVPNLFFSGEIIALDGPTGGYNLQKAFSTGYLAGNSV
ncbi:NAD(P)/FAD-dependent oxidoreductase [Patescibacteria group bacterium]